MKASSLWRRQTAILFLINDETALSKFISCMGRTRLEVLIPDFTWGGVQAEPCNLQRPQERSQLMFMQKSAEQSHVQAAEWAESSSGDQHGALLEQRQPCKGTALSETQTTCTTPGWGSCLQMAPARKSTEGRIKPFIMLTKIGHRTLYLTQS